MLSSSAPRKKHANTHHQERASAYDPSTNVAGQFNPEDSQQQIKRKPAVRQSSRDDLPPYGLQDARSQNQRSPNMAASEDGTSWAAPSRNSRILRGQYEDQSRHGDPVQPEPSGQMGVTSRISKVSRLNGRNKLSEGKNFQIHMVQYE